ncbi:MAG TPA: bifunctional 4-hydroxy-2-oxoglutarate aldolase/2-dehydro-3-deoxy-phosphogluconate aldolase [Sumerlaeia bacterium]|nr:bifunctional 4-hydroxy-2-oxoglutarate aldolase/2-dehydro-3-deoxy-phosphogluconate aldolase [Sumerlaeia bacterium]
MGLQTVLEKIEATRVIPMTSVAKADDVIPLCGALKAGGLEIVEITLRTPVALDAIRFVAREFPEFVLGAGTVTAIEELEAAHEAGAQFAVAPGLNPRVVRRAQKLGFPFFPGVATPTDIEAALELGCRMPTGSVILKLFPVEILGGPRIISALAGPYAPKGVRFIPTGGVSAANMTDYLAQPAVLAVGGSWLAPRSLVEKKDWSEISRLAAEAVALASRIAAPGP